jgi:hypothetical protein
MKRLIVLTAICAISMAGFVGCGEETKTKDTKVNKTPTGSTTTEKTESTTKKGSDPPPKP